MVVAGLLSGLLSHLHPHEPFVVPDKATLEHMCRFANAVGAMTSLKRGAIPGLLPERGSKIYETDVKPSRKS